MIDSLVSSSWLKAHINDANLIILDASQKSNKAQLTTTTETAQIPNSIAFDLKVFSDSKSDFPNTIPSSEQFEKEACNLGITNSSTIIVYDNLGIYTSPRVWWLFKAMGHKNVAVLDGGLPDWIAMGFDTTQNKQTELAHNSKGYSAKLDSNLVRNFEAITSNLTTKKEIIIDARSHNRFHALVPEPRKGLRGGHIPNSINIPFEAVLQNGYLKSKEELKQLFSSFNLAEKPLAFTCGSGITACIVYLASEQVLENSKAVYDGSWTEWAQLSKV